jgi:hypothetical protein
MTIQTYKRIFETSKVINTALDPDSEQALWDEDHTGDENSDVQVTDTFEDGTTVTFVWNKAKSNENIGSPGENNDGFSFYRARYIYRDHYTWYPKPGEIKITTPGGKGAVGTVYDGEKRATFVVQEKEEGKDANGNRKIRIISATYANEIIQNKYLWRALEMTKREGGYVPHKEVNKGDNERIRLLHLKRACQELSDSEK